MKKSRRAAHLARICRRLIYLSGGTFEPGRSLYDLALKPALQIVGVKSHSGTARKFISDNIQQLDEHLRVHATEVVAGKKTRRAAAVVRKITASAVLSDQHDRYLASREFLESFEWRQLRMKALIMHGRKCSCCGATPETGAVMNVDHIKPRKFFPGLALDIDNLQVLCHECNHGKGNWDQTDWR